MYLVWILVGTQLYLHICTRACLRCGICLLIVLALLVDWLCMCSIYTVFMLLSSYEPIIITSPSFSEKPHCASYSLLLVSFAPMHTKIDFPYWWHLDYNYQDSAYEWWTQNMLPHGSNMVSGLAQAYFSNYDHFIVQSWIHTTFWTDVAKAVYVIGLSLSSSPSLLAFVYSALGITVNASEVICSIYIGILPPLMHIKKFGHLVYIYSIWGAYLFLAHIF